MVRIRNLVFVGAVILVSGSSARAGDAPTQLGTTAQQMADDASAGLEYGQLPWGSARDAFKAASPEQRAELVKLGLGWAKTYFASDEFKAAYEKMRTERKPSPPEARGTIDEELAKLKAETEQQIADMKKGLEQLTDEQRKQAEEGVKQAEENIRKNQADPEFQKLQRQGLEIQREAEQTQYKQDLEEWEKKYPADSRVLIAQRINEWLETCKDVDFSAQLDSSGDRTKFVDPAFEGKSGDWKTCYRGGKPALDAAREFAAAWLTELKP